MTDAAKKRPLPEDAEPGHPVHKDRLTYCRTCGGNGRKRGARTFGACNGCGGFGKTSKDSMGRVILWTRDGWVVRP